MFGVVRVVTGLAGHRLGRVVEKLKVDGGLRFAGMARLAVFPLRNQSVAGCLSFERMAGCAVKFRQRFAFESGLGMTGNAGVELRCIRKSKVVAVASGAGEAKVERMGLMTGRGRCALPYLRRHAFGALAFERVQAHGAAAFAFARAARG